MKITILTAGMALGLFAILFTSCEKNESKPVTPSCEKKMSLKELVSHPQFISAFKQIEEAYVRNNPESRTQFIAPIFTNGGFGIGQCLVFDCSSGPWCSITAGQFAFFDATLDGNDFYRENNDGTVSVHITSNNVFADHYDIASNVDLFTNSGNLSMNYTGPVISFDITDEFGNVLFTVKFIDQFANPNAVSFHGNGRVSVSGTGAGQNLVGRITANPGWTQA